MVSVKTHHSTEKVHAPLNDQPIVGLSNSQSRNNDLPDIAVQGLISLKAP